MQVQRAKWVTTASCKVHTGEFLLSHGKGSRVAINFNMRGGRIDQGGSWSPGQGQRGDEESTRDHFLLECFRWNRARDREVVEEKLEERRRRRLYFLLIDRPNRLRP